MPHLRPLNVTFRVLMIGHRSQKWWGSAPLSTAGEVSVRVLPSAIDGSSRAGTPRLCEAERREGGKLHTFFYNSVQAVSTRGLAIPTSAGSSGGDVPALRGVAVQRTCRQSRRQEGRGLRV